MSATLVPLVSRETKKNAILERVIETIHNHTIASDATLDRVNRQLALAREYVDLKASEDLHSADDLPNIGLFGLSDLLESVSRNLLELENVLTGIANDVHAVLHPELHPEDGAAR